MSSSICVYSEPQDLLSVSMRDDLRHVLSRAAAVIEREELLVFGEVTILIVDVERISMLHGEYLSDPTPTDIITFPHPQEFQSSVIGGDIAICLDAVREQAEEAGQSLERELAFVGVHGLLHLTGWDDATRAQRDLMFERQETILRRVFGDHAS